MTVGPDRAAHVYLGAFVEELARAGVRDVCIAPGSRSAPLALLMARHQRFDLWMHLDERSAAFFALGLARARGVPVALLCTSGSAAANFLPAVVEARTAGVPLLVFTADRPPELRDVGAPQTIDQNRLFGTHAKWFVDVALPEATADLLRYARTLACRAVALACATPRGPVHLNFPLREPLVPVPTVPPVDLAPVDSLAWHGRERDEPWVQVSEPVAALDEPAVTRLAALLWEADRPLIICGPQRDASLAAPLASLAKALSAPLLSDPLSRVRWGTHDRVAIIDCYDAALRDQRTVDSLAPDLVLRFGATPTSKPLLQFIQRHGLARQIVVQDAGWSDPTLLAAEMVHADATTLCRDLLAQVLGGGAKQSRGWLAEWQRVNDVARAALDRFIAGIDEPFEGAVLAEVSRALPDEGTLFVSSSMPVRDLDAFGAGDARNLQVLSNRGANGIDGVVSTALGVAAAGEHDRAPLVLVIGDIAFYHDMNGLLAARLHSLNATIVVINNDGGGIFSFLPQASERAHFEQLFGTPHGLSFAPAAAQYGAQYQRVQTAAALRRAVDASIRTRGLHIVELVTDRVRNVELHRGAWAAVAAALHDR